MPDWSAVAQEWSVRGDTTYLNHGSYGPPPRTVLQRRHELQQQLDCQPMDFFNRHFEELWLTSRTALARFLNTPPQHLVFVENSTSGMNQVAHNFPLRPGQEVVLTNHEYGAVKRIWERACQRVGAKVVTARLPEPLESAEQVVASIMAECGPETALIVVSHVTSATALILPVAEICQAAQARNIPVCIDGPHAPLQVPIDLQAIQATFYTASCHKWLCAPFGSGFLYVAPQFQSTFAPSQLSWGRIQPAEPQVWYDEFMWTGTRDSSPYFSIPRAIEYFEQLGVEAVRQRLFGLTDYAAGELGRLLGTQPLARGTGWYGSMAHFPLPPVSSRELQQALWTQYHIEVPIIDWNQRQFIRVSCHLYNTSQQVDYLISSLAKLLYD